MPKIGNLRWDEQQLAEYAGKRDRWTTGGNFQAKADAVNPPGAASSPPSKYNAVKTDGYASKREAKRAAALRQLEQAGQIRNLREQVPYVLIPRQLGPGGGVAERACTYKADFVYEELTVEGWREVVEDCKGFRTPDYVIKRKLMRFTHGVEIRET